MAKQSESSSPSSSFPSRGISFSQQPFSSLSSYHSSQKHKKQNLISFFFFFGGYLLLISGDGDAAQTELLWWCCVRVTGAWAGVAAAMGWCGTPTWSHMRPVITRSPWFKLILVSKIKVKFSRRLLLLMLVFMMVMAAPRLPDLLTSISFLICIVSFVLFYFLVLIGALYDAFSCFLCNVHAIMGWFQNLIFFLKIVFFFNFWWGH